MWEDARVVVPGGWPKTEPTLFDDYFPLKAMGFASAAHQNSSGADRTSLCEGSLSARIARSGTRCTLPRACRGRMAVPRSAEQRRAARIKAAQVRLHFS